MTPNRPIPTLLAGLLLAVPLAHAQEYRHPSGFEPKPVFEDDAPARKPYLAQPPTPAIAPPAPAVPPPVAKEAAPRPPAAGAGPQALPPTEIIREPGRDHHDPAHARPGPLVEDEAPARKPYPPQSTPKAVAPPALSPPQAPATQTQAASAQPEPAHRRYKAASARPDEPPKRYPVAATQPEASQVPVSAPPPAPPTPSTNPLVENYPLGLIALALVGFVVWNIRGNARTDKAAPTAATPARPTGPTGVARYLTQLEAKAKAEQGTGVARYLNRLAAETKPADS
ncbi:hypothetical protein SAMN02949497_4040 [Methylomagnum ishizawai]|uniref:Meckel syndrome type 1 protein n=1 Tax=Methylomagnum ishizawai TaxID=1760988 RepID=A0A1Y6D8U0_9GAMM|nr:hypothetical protein [Methylomagnum ishizawai]SMF96634.1 hypothetical protein SAMN02949497_4040 [Methylomagnum ishizawai]